MTDVTRDALTELPEPSELSALAARAADVVVRMAIARAAARPAAVVPGPTCA